MNLTMPLPSLHRHTDAGSDDDSSVGAGELAAPPSPTGPAAEEVAVGEGMRGAQVRVGGVRGWPAVVRASCMHKVVAVLSSQLPSHPHLPLPLSIC